MTFYYQTSLEIFLIVLVCCAILCLIMATINLIKIGKLQRKLKELLKLKEKYAQESNKTKEVADE